MTTKPKVKVAVRTDWHNPAAVPESKLGRGWRLALSSEIKPDGTSPIAWKCQAWAVAEEGYSAEWMEKLFACTSPNLTYRTKEPLPATT
jgi:hypothetical protein